MSYAGHKRLDGGEHTLYLGSKFNFPKHVTSFGRRFSRIHHSQKGHPPDLRFHLDQMANGILTTTRNAPGLPQSRVRLLTQADFRLLFRKLPCTKTV